MKLFKLSFSILATLSFAITTSLIFDVSIFSTLILSTVGMIAFDIWG